LNQAVSVELLEAVARTTLTVVLGVLVAMTLAVAARRLLHHRLQRRHDRMVAASRPLLLSIVASGPVDPETVARLAALPNRLWGACEPAVVSMLAKVRGSSHHALVSVLVQRGTLDRAVQRTRSWSLIARCEAAELIGVSGHRPGGPALVRLLEDRSPEVRRVAARALGRLGDPAGAVPVFNAALGDRALASRDVAAALVLLDAEATPTLVGIVAEAREPAIRSIGAEVLGLRGTMEATGLLVGMIGNDPSMEVRIRSARALGRIGSDAAVDPLTAVLSSDVPELRAVAARALGQVGSSRAVPALVDCLGDPTHRVAVNAAESLTGLGDAGHRALSSVAESGDARPAAYAREALALYQLGRRPFERLLV
jgi:HEAT repeat protein